MGIWFFHCEQASLSSFMRVLDKPSQQGECMETVNFLIHVMGVDSQQNLARDPLLKAWFVVPSLQSMSASNREFYL